jgi:PAS domain-containing protein
MPLSALEIASGTALAERHRLDALLEAVPLAVALFDGALTLVATNARYRDLTGLDVAQANGRPIYDAFPNALADLTEQVDIAAAGRLGARAVPASRWAPTRRGDFRAPRRWAGRARRALRRQRRHGARGAS